MHFNVSFTNKCLFFCFLNLNQVILVSLEHSKDRSTCIISYKLSVFHNVSSETEDMLCISQSSATKTIWAAASGSSFAWF